MEHGKQGILDGRVAVISGASSGVGAATARALAAGGARVVLMARRKDKLDALAVSVREAGGRADVYELDVRDRVAVEATATAVRASAGRVDSAPKRVNLSRVTIAPLAQPG